MRAFLVRIGVDQAYGAWNAPVDPATGEFVYVPIPDGSTRFRPNCNRRFHEAVPNLTSFCECRGLDLFDDLRFDKTLLPHSMHLDPDFQHLTYGDDGSRRGAGVATLGTGDVVAFYAGLRPVSKCPHKLLYALVGIYMVDAVQKITDIPAACWPQNAHTRRLKHWPTDVVVRAKPKVSGRLERCIPIGEWREGAYRVRRDLLKVWGGLSVRDGFIQRSAVPPSFLQPERFLAWFRQQGVGVVNRNF